MTLPQIAVLSLGGTISSTRSGSGPGVTPTLTGEALVESVPEIAKVAEISAVAFRQLASPEITIDDLVGLAAEISRRVDEGTAGVVVTQGTDTIEESSFVLDLLLDLDAPVVVTGAMRNPTLPGADGPANLLAAVQVATSEAARGLGTIVVFNDEIHTARYVRKTHTQSPATFKSPPVGPLGWVSEGTPRIALRPVNRHHVNPGGLAGPSGGPPHRSPGRRRTPAGGGQGGRLRRARGRGNRRRPHAFVYSRATDRARAGDAGHPRLAHRQR